MSNTIHWGSTTAGNASEIYIRETPQDVMDEANKIYLDGGWKDIASHKHIHNVPAQQFYTYNDDSAKIDGLIGVIDDILTAIQPVIDIGSMKKIAKKLNGIRWQNQWSTGFNQNINTKQHIENFDKNCEPKENKIQLEEDLFEI